MADLDGILSNLLIESRASLYQRRGTSILVLLVVLLLADGVLVKRRILLALLSLHKLLHAHGLLRRQLL